MTRLYQLAALNHARDLAERAAILHEWRTGNPSRVASGRLLVLNARIARDTAARIVPTFTPPPERTA